MRELSNGPRKRTQSLASVTDKFWSSVQLVKAARSKTELKDANEVFCRRLGFDNFGYATRNSGCGLSGYDYFHNFSGAYGNYRYEHIYRTEPDKDPILKHLRSGLPAASFSCAEGVDIPLTTAQDYSGILMDAADHGIRAGIGVPIASRKLRWGFMLLTTDETDRIADVRNFLPHLCLFAQYTFCKEESLRSELAPQSLTKREVEVLRWASVGKTSWEIGVILCISENTVNFHLSNTAKALGTTGRQATCARAIALGLVAL